MSPIFRRPVPNTIALGGVATGIIKAQEAASAVVTRRPEASILSASAEAEMSGIIVAASAVFEVTSVAKVTRVATPAIMETSPRLPRAVA